MNGFKFSYLADWISGIWYSTTGTKLSALDMKGPDIQPFLYPVGYKNKYQTWQDIWQDISGRNLSICPDIRYERI